MTLYYGDYLELPLLIATHMGITENVSVGGYIVEGVEEVSSKYITVLLDSNCMLRKCGTKVPVDGIGNPVRSMRRISVKTAYTYRRGALTQEEAYTYDLQEIRELAVKVGKKLRFQGYWPMFTYKVMAMMLLTGFVIVTAWQPDVVWGWVSLFMVEIILLGTAAMHSAHAGKRYDSR